MKKNIIETNFDIEKLDALKMYLTRKDGDLESEIDDFLEKLYLKTVPAAIRDFISSKQEGAKSESVESKKMERKRQNFNSLSAKTENLKSELSAESGDFNV